MTTTTGSSPRVVIGLPVHNGAQHLVGALESLLIQSYSDFTLVFVDNCSTDGTPEIAQRYAALDARIVVERNRALLGMTDNFRRAYELAVERNAPFDYFCWASDHDLWHPSWLEALVQELDADPRLVGAFPFAIPLAPDGSERPLVRLRWDTTRSGGAVGRVRTVAHGIPVRAGSVVYGLFRADAIEQCGIYRSIIEPDRLLVAQLSALGPMKQVPRALWSRRFGEVKPTRDRQRARLFTDEVPWHAQLPPALVHAILLFEWAAIRAEARPEAGRLKGAVLAGAYFVYASVARVEMLARRRSKSSQRRARRLRSRLTRLRRSKQLIRQVRSFDRRARRLLGR